MLRQCATADLERVTVHRQEVATFTAKCEKYVGTESGGMDQAISMMGQLGVAKMIEFDPVSCPDEC